MLIFNFNLIVNFIQNLGPEELNEPYNNRITEEFHDYGITPLQNELCRGIDANCSLAIQQSKSSNECAIHLDTDWLQN